MADDPYAAFPAGFFDRSDPSDDARFYGPARLVTHIDAGAIAAVGALYEELEVEGRVLDLCSSWISHFRTAPTELIALGMNAEELAANPQAARWVVHDLNADPTLPFEDGELDHAVCCVSVDYLVRPFEVFAEIARCLRPGGRFACTFSNRCFPTKAIRGWLATDDASHVRVVEEYFARTPGFVDVRSDERIPPGRGGDPLWAVWAERG
ncbi:MAG: class I SAM-dependent methyltransferase [Actinomycetota bacterium]